MENFNFKIYSISKITKEKRIKFYFENYYSAFAEWERLTKIFGIWYEFYIEAIPLKMRPYDLPKL